MTTNPLARTDNDGDVHDALWYLLTNEQPGVRICGLMVFMDLVTRENFDYSAIGGDTRFGGRSRTIVSRYDEFVDSIRWMALHDESASVRQQAQEALDELEP